MFLFKYNLLYQLFCNYVFIPNDEKIKQVNQMLILFLMVYFFVVVVE